VAKNARRERLFLIAVLFAGLLLRFWGLTAQSLWRDEVDTYVFATRSWSQVLGMFTRPGENGPLYFLLMRFWIALTGKSDFALRYSSLLAGVLVLPLLYRLCAPKLGRQTALATTFLAAISPFFIWYSQEAKMYSLLLLLAVLATWLYVEALARGGWRWPAYFVVTVAAIYVHLLAALLIPLHLLLGVFFWRQWRQQWWQGALTFAAFVLPYLPLAWWEKKLLFSPTFRTGHAWVPLADIFRRQFAVTFFGIQTLPHPWHLPTGVILAPLLFLAVVGLLAPQLKKPVRLALLSWFVGGVLGIYLISLGMPIYLERYLIWTGPAVLALVAAGLIALKANARLVALTAFFLVLMSMGWGVVHQQAYPIKTDLRDLTHDWERMRQPGDLVIFQIPYMKYSFWFYTARRPPFREGLYTNSGMTAAEVNKQMRQQVAGRKRVWLVVSEEWMWDNRQLVRKWLQAHGRLLWRKSYTGAELLLFQLK